MLSFCDAILGSELVSCRQRLHLSSDRPNKCCHLTRIAATTTVCRLPRAIILR